MIEWILKQGNKIIYRCDTQSEIESFIAMSGIKANYCDYKTNKSMTKRTNIYKVEG